MLVLSSTSKEYVRVPVYAKEGSTVVNPTADAVVMAFKTGSAAPSGGDFIAAEWETDTDPVPDRYYARALVGPGTSAVLTAGTYTVWVKITDVQEIPVRPAGLLRVV